MDKGTLLAALERDVLAASPMLLGSFIVRGARKARIVEVEAYRALDDPACHAFQCRSERNEVMYGPAGRAYIYFSYGVHWMLNIVAHAGEDAAAILVRAAEPVHGFDEMRALRPQAKRTQDLLSGPGKLCAAFSITRADNGIDLFAESGEPGALRIEAGEPTERVIVGRRIGITKAADYPWRFIDGESLEWVSRPLPSQLTRSTDA